MKKSQKFLLYFLLLLILCIIPISTGLYSFSKNTVNVGEKNVQYISVNNKTITQRIYIEGKIKHLGIRLLAPSGDSYKDSKLTISVEQSGKIITDTVLLKDLDKISNVKEINGTEDKIYFVEKSLRKLKKGTANIKISTCRLPEGADLYCCISEDVTTGLPAAYCGDLCLNKPIMLQYNVFQFNFHFYYESIFIILLIILIISTAYMLSFRSEFLKNKSWALYFLTFSIIIVVIAIQNPYASFLGEPRSEAVYEFWYKAHEWGFFKSLMSLMSGEALAWLERIFMWIADTISPTKYVFVVAQMIETIWIAFVCSLPCCKFFKKYFSDPVRVGISIFIGCFLFFDAQYFFWSCSYWSIVFIVFFALMPFDQMSRLTYLAGIILTVILCISRIYHILFIPVAILILIMNLKKRKIRLNIFCLAIIFSATFEGVYSLANKNNLVGNGSFLNDIKNIGFFRIIENTLYYQLQVMNSFLFGNVHFQGLPINILMLLGMIAVIFLLGYKIYKKKVLQACYFGILGYISLGTIAINVYVSGAHKEVAFPMDYSKQVDWTQNIYQQADLHYSFAYFAFFMILLGCIYLVKTTVLQYDEEIKKININEIVVIYLAMAILASISIKPRIDYNSISVEWKSLYKVTEKDKYFLAVNTNYGVAPISMEKGTDEYIYGVNSNNELFQWNIGNDAYQMSMPYSEAEIGKISDISSKKIVSITARRAIVNFDVKYVAVLKDKDGNVIEKINQAEKENRYWLDFIPKSLAENVYSISFELSDGNKAYIEDGLQVGYIK